MNPTMPSEASPAWRQQVNAYGYPYTGMAQNNIKPFYRVNPARPVLPSPPPLSMPPPAPAQNRINSHHPVFIAFKRSSHLQDPIHQKNPLVNYDRVLNYNFLDNQLLNLKTLFITTPRVIFRALKGSSDFSFSESMLLAKVPYYAGGLMFVLSPLAAKSNLAAIRTAVGVGSYYVFNQMADWFVNRLYKLRWGIPLDLKYRGANGDVQLALISAKFPRIDLLTKGHYAEMRRKMGIPEDVADPDAACNEQIRKLIVSSRTTKLLLGNFFAAVGAGFLALSDIWSPLLHPDGIKGFARNAWELLSDARAGNVLERTVGLARSIGAWMSEGTLLKTAGAPGVSPLPGRIALFGGAGLLFLTVLHSLFVLRRKEYEPWSPLPTPYPGSLVNTPDSGLDRSGSDRFLIGHEEATS